MAHSYIKLDFGTDEEKAQAGATQARRLEAGIFAWTRGCFTNLTVRRATRGESGSKPAPVEKPTPARQVQGKDGSKSPRQKRRPKQASRPRKKSAPAANGKVALLVRLYFSFYSHEKAFRTALARAHFRWEEPFKSASPKVVHHSDPEFESTDRQFEALE